MTDLAEIDALYKQFRSRPGAPAWRATDEITNPSGAAVRRAAFYIKVIKREDKGSRNGRAERAKAQAFERMKERGLTLPNEESLINFMRRSKRKPKRANQRIGADDRN